ncbi:MAG: MaoC family dehydratase [Lachnospiraceae bacterium]|nr:MaoC family dehydratase [Lachnospiraceae bacterium]
MNNYGFEELEIGHSESFPVTLTAEMMQAFMGLTGDANPLHNDREYALKEGFDDTVAYGMLTASFLSTLAGVYLPGEKSLIQNVEIKFMKPVYPGDSLTVEGTVAEKNEAYKVLKLKVNIRKSSGEKVLRGSMQVGIRS